MTRPTPRRPETAKPPRKRATRTLPAGDINSWYDHLNRDQQFREARRDLCDAIRAAGASMVLPVDANTQLAVFALLTVIDRAFRASPKRQRPEDSGTGKTWKALSAFPARLRAIATEIERVNRSPFFYLPDLTLPLDLQMHADFIAERNAAARWRARKPRRHSDSLFQLSDLVKRLTGGFHDKEVSRLLNAAANALGIDFQMDALSLVQARYRRTRRST